jgi:hypothetical protein
VQYTVTILSTLPVLSGCPAGTTNYECYASVPAAATVTAKDACGAVLPVTPNETQTNPGSSSNNIITRTWTATDCAGNVSSCTQTITVNDDQAPTILPNSANPMAVTLNTAYVEPGVTAGDNCGVVTVTTNGAVNTTVVGTYTVTYTATDSCGNRSTATRTVNVSGTQYQAAGKSCVVNGVLCPGHVILQPVNADGTSSFKQGSTVPCKFMVFDANCNSVGTPGVVTSFTLVNTSGGAPGVNESVTSTTPDTAFRWDSTAQQWIFNLNTKNLPKNTTFTYIISLNDGSNIQFSFGLK